MNSIEINLSEIKSNPNNPRIIKDDKFHKLVESIKTFPRMLEIRPIVVNKDMIVLGGNMRLKACKEAGLKKVPVIFADDLSEEQQREFIIKDNVGFGEWDWAMLANEWDTDELTEWGLDIPDFAIPPSEDELIGEEKNKPATMKITFPSVLDLSGCEQPIKDLLNKICPDAYFSVSAGEI